MTTKTSDLIPLRQWIKGALDSSGSSNNSVISEASTSSYLTACLKIAISLTEQIGNAEKLEDLGVSREIDLLPASAIQDWAEFVWIRLKKSHCNDTQYNIHGKSDDYHRERSWNDDALVNRPLPCETFTSDSVTVTSFGWEDENEQALDEELKAILESFGDDEFEATEPTAEVQILSPESPQPHCAKKSSAFENINYLDVHSACLRSPESDPSNFLNSDLGKSEGRLRRIYCLGLVFYELFSGGELPPPELFSLVSSYRDFISLPTLTITRKSKDDQTFKTDFKRCPDPFGSREGLRLGQLSSEYLRLMGLPGPLCNLIFNMLDCIYGDFSGDESSTKMSDFTSDLQLMIEKPAKFLRDLDLEKLTLSGLELNESFLSREDELESIKSCYHRCVSESYELAIITGDSGTGKSWLANRVGAFVTAHGGVFLNGKFDQMKRVLPFSALASAFDQYCDLLIKENESDWAKRVVNKLISALGKDASHLSKVIPKLNQILSCNASVVDSSCDQQCANALQRLHYLLYQFVDVISSNSTVSMTLFLDDVQWADSASISVLNQLLLKRNKHFFFLGCCRGSEMEDDHPFWDMIKSIKGFGIKTTVVKLKCLEKDALNAIVSELLCLSPRVVRSLSDVLYVKTKGNPLFFCQMMRSLNRDGLLRLSLRRQRWVWDNEEILSMKLPDDIAVCFAHGISKLPIEVQSALRTLSMFGASIRCKYIEALESQLRLKLIEPLKIALAEGLVSNLRGSFHFCHDRLQEASYAMTEAQDRYRDHLTFGLCLVKVSFDTSDTELLFTAVNQINFGGPAVVSNAQECANMSKYNLIAGKKALEMSNFLSAHSFFSFGIDFLPNGHWEYHYELTLELFDLACKSALATGNIHSLRVLSDGVMQNARSFEDKLNTYFTLISSLAYASKISEALEKGYDILSRLGEHIPSNPSNEDLDQHIRKTQSLIRGITENDILNYSHMTDTNKLDAMKFLAQLEIITLMVKPTLHPFVTLKMVRLTILHGLSPASPIGFVYFGSLLAKRGNIMAGHQFTLLAKALLEKLEARDVAGEVICVATEVQCFLEPVQAASNFFAVQGEPAAMRAGDIHWACINRLQYCCMMFWTCSNLAVVSEMFAEASQFMREQHHRTSLLFLLPVQKMILTLIGETEALADNELLRTIQENKNPRHLMML
eukprot:CCRYP_005628-RA/>CCRYP_005628-RA protein AED:0.02 eAED:0.02 QI:105/1/1/1/1/1/2/1150/1171